MNKRASITLEQVNKLIDMCKDSFPEYPNIRFVTKYGTNEVYFDSDKQGHPDPHEYHWFELSVTELPRVILEKLERYAKDDEELKHHELHNAYQSGGEMLFFAYSEGKHVIDLLYKEYKKLKKWESLISQN